MTAVITLLIFFACCCGGMIIGIKIDDWIDKD